MIITFESKPEARHHYPAAQHPYDFTTRPQEVSAIDNPDYYRLLKEYESLTGQGIILNTSFNLHGEPIVASPSDALSRLRAVGASIPGPRQCLDHQEKLMSCIWIAVRSSP